MTKPSLFFLVIIFVSNLVFAQTGSLEGIISCDQGAPVEGAIVVVAGQYTDTTNADGYFFIEGIPVGFHFAQVIVEGFTTVYGSVVQIMSGQVTFFDYSVPCPELTVAPLTLDVIIEPNATSTEFLTLTNPDEGIIEWSADVVILTDKNPEDLFDVIISVPLNPGMAEYGIECDGNFMYTSSPSTGTFNKYAMDGAFIESFSGPGVYDMAWDGTYFYGGNGSTMIFEMDLGQQQIISTFNVAQNVRAIAYNDDEGVFYGYNWDGDIITFDHAGTLLGVAPVVPGGPVYAGFAYDNVTDGGPYIWGYGLLDNDPNTLIQLELPSFLPTGLTASLETILGIPLTNGAGGLFTHPDFYPELMALGGIVQGERLWILELTEYDTWISISPASGTLSQGESEEMTVYFDATDLYPDTYEAEIQFSTSPNVSSPIVNVTMIIEGEPGVDNLQSVVNCTDVILSWETIPPNTPVDSFYVYRDNEKIATTILPNYEDVFLYPEMEYEYYVTGFFFPGLESDPSYPVSEIIPLPDSLEPQNLQVIIINDSLFLTWDPPNGCLIPDGYNLYKDGNLIGFIGGGNPVFILASPGEYMVTAVYYFGESGPSNTVLITGIPELEVAPISIYPNPASEIIHIRSFEDIENVTIYDMKSSVVLMQKASKKDLEINVSGLEPGMFYLKLKTQDGIIVKKLVIK
ncbi:MAG: T9SS type A sorting domain-containing protein [Bacteroidales bacterium]|nr:T9SS type A sorting domain-containing protein [Bacteroidales bacterium]